MKLSRKQKLQVAHAKPNSQYQLLASVGAVRSGKSVAATIGHCAHVVAHGLHLDHAIVGATETTVRRNLALPPLGYLDTLRAFGFEPRLRTSAGAHIEIPWGVDGRVCRIWIFGGQDASAAVDRMAGSTWGSMMVDEMTRIPEDVWQMAWTRLSVKDAKAWTTLNPAGSHHWARRTLEDAPRTRIVHFTMKDNPGLSREARERIEAGLSGHAYQRLVLGEWADAVGLVFPHWRRAERPSRTRDWAMGVDWASSGVFAAVLTCGSEDVSHHVVVSERRHDAVADGVLTDTEHAVRTHRWAQEVSGAPPSTIRLVGDPSTSAGFQRQMERLGYHWRDGDNRVLPGIRETAAKLETGAMRIGTSLHHLPAELGTYQWDAKAAASGEDAPHKRDDHLCDALRYLCHTGPPPRLLGDVGF